MERVELDLVLREGNKSLYSTNLTLGSDVLQCQHTLLLTVYSKIDLPSSEQRKSETAIIVRKVEVHRIFV